MSKDVKKSSASALAPPPLPGSLKKKITEIPIAARIKG
jgi:hypothetical protein